MNNYCGFIEVYTNGKDVFPLDNVRPIKALAEDLLITANCRFIYTVAIFKIKLK